MPVAMAFAVVATANHWTLDVLAGAVVAFAGLPLEHLRRRYVAPWRRAHDEAGPDEPVDPSDDE